MDLSQALHEARLGATIRDDGGTMKLGWSLKFVPNTDKPNMAKPKHMREGKFVYIRPTGEDAHQILFVSHHRASVAWNVVVPAPAKPKRAPNAK